MKALEDDSDFRLKTLKENDMDNKDIEEIKTRLKVSFCILKAKSCIFLGCLKAEKLEQKLNNIRDFSSKSSNNIFAAFSKVKIELKLHTFKAIRYSLEKRQIINQKATNQSLLRLNKYN